ncbi:alpha/beta-hydrolase [Pluteus cervinus]|uniref:Alpha/beta-hydrolase n=1 Tax=Pluteus cervinus TaxID=181527 RepID=A0ACD3A3I1_9AGAR|nr:alpha/beta-hydrolase [Pluteus cervinus]
MVTFQRKIIYMGYAPIGARNEQLKDVPKALLDGLSCEEVEISGSDGVKLAGIEVSQEQTQAASPPTILLYLQGNAGNPLHRLPIFQTLLHHKSSASKPLKVLSVAPRSYWKSTNRRPTQVGILSDYTHIIHHTLRSYPQSPIILYGHSLGGSIAVCLLAHLDKLKRESAVKQVGYSRIRGFILENPFSSIPNMVRALYPQPWLPYHYLAPLALDKWDAYQALKETTALSILDPNVEGGEVTASVLGRVAKDMLVLVSENDELVPSSMGRVLFDASKDGRNMENVGDEAGLGRVKVVRGALHEDMWRKWEWEKFVWGYIESVEKRWDVESDLTANDS